MRSSPQSTGELKFEFLSPTNLLLTSRKDVLNHLKKKKNDAAEPEEQGDEERKQGEFKKWADIKMRQFRRKMPKRKRLVSNQVLVNSKVKAIRREVEQSGEPAATDLFRHEPVVFIPRLLSIVKNMDLKETLDTYVTSHIRDVET